MWLFSFGLNLVQPLYFVEMQSNHVRPIVLHLSLMWLSLEHFLVSVAGCVDGLAAADLRLRCVIVADSNF